MIIKIKKLGLSNIIPGQKVQFVLKRGADKTDMEIVKIKYPISKTTFVNIDKTKDKLEITKNINLDCLIKLFPSSSKFLSTHNDNI